MTKYNPKPGDIVNFKNPSIETNHRGIVLEYRPGRSINVGPKRDVLVRFNSPIWAGGPLEAWCAVEDLTLIWPTLRKANEVKPTVTYTNSSTKTTTNYNDYNFQINKDNKLAQSTFSASDRPWTRYYVTADEFFEILRAAFDDSFGGGSETPWHPEDMYINVSTTLDIVASSLTNITNLKAGRNVKSIKEI